jgi:hypothetical protein
MPPQQSDGLLDLIDQMFNLGTHGSDFLDELCDAWGSPEDDRQGGCLRI